MHALTVDDCCRNLGSEKQLVVFDFGAFRIGRQVTVVVHDPRASVLASGDAYVKQRGYARYKESLNLARNNTWIVPGVKPTGYTLHFFQYTVLLDSVSG